MKKNNVKTWKWAAGIIFLLLLPAHNLYIKMDCYTLSPNTESILYLYNDKFVSSGSTISTGDMVNVSIFTPDGWMHPPHTRWWMEGSITCLNFRTGNPGTCLAGVSTSFKSECLGAEAFNKYLEEMGILNIIERREREGNENLPATWRYTQHAKAVFQVGEEFTEHFLTPLGFPVELIPMYNPYLLNKGDELTIQLVVDGEPMGDQWIYAGFEREGEEITSFRGRTDHRGNVAIPLDEYGRWFIRTAYMTTSIEPGTNYESSFASLSFEIS